MEAENYNGDIGDYILRIKHLNQLVQASGVTFRAMIEKRLTRSMRLRLSMEPDIDDDNVWLRLVVRVGKLEERFQEEERLLKELRGGTEKKKEEKITKTVQARTDPVKAEKWKAVKTANPQDRFPRPIDFANLTEGEKKQREERLRGISEETIKARKAKQACIRCGQTGHGQYTCPSSRPVVSAVKTEPQKRKRSVKEEDEPEQPLAKKISALVTSRGRIYELTEEDEEMED